MDQLHRRLTDEHIKVLLQSYSLGKMSRAQVQEMLGVGKTRFFAFGLLLQRRNRPSSFLSMISAGKILFWLFHQRTDLEWLH